MRSREENRKNCVIKSDIGRSDEETCIDFLCRVCAANYTNHQRRYVTRFRVSDRRVVDISSEKCDKFPRDRPITAWDAGRWVGRYRRTLSDLAMNGIECLRWVVSFSDCCHFLRIFVTDNRCSQEADCVIKYEMCAANDGEGELQWEWMIQGRLRLQTQRTAVHHVRRKCFFESKLQIVLLNSKRRRET